MKDCLIQQMFIHFAFLNCKGYCNSSMLCLLELRKVGLGRSLHWSSMAFGSSPKLEWWITLFPPKLGKKIPLFWRQTCSSLVVSFCWVVCSSLLTCWSLSDVSWRTFSCDTVTLFFTFIFPTRSRTSACSFLMMPLA